MLCPKCGYYAEGDEIACPECGEILKKEYDIRETGAQAIRQGKRAREAALRRSVPKEEETPARRRRTGASRSDTEIRGAAKEQAAFEQDQGSIGVSEEKEAERGAGFERRRRPMYDDESLETEQAVIDEARYQNSRGSRYHLINWMKVALCVFAVTAVIAAGGWFFLNKTDAGQKIMARLGREANSTALWAVGEDMMNEGDIDGAIAAFEKAKKLDAEQGTVDVDGLLLLGSAYEAAGRVDDAADLYEQIYNETPSRTEAYVNHIRILLARKKPGDEALAAELMKLAYQKTGDSSFNTQRNDLIPAPPEVDLTAGYYETKKYIAITSYQGYDVYYTFDENAELPSGGNLFKERVFLDEGTHALRAVAVNGELVSDELRGTYKIIMPSPMTPRCTLAPNTYKNRQKVKLKPGKDNENDDDIVIYYTVDGSTPDADSPIFDGEAIQLPSGWVTLKAVAVNKYHKVSNMLEVKYKIEAKPFPLAAYDPTTDLIGKIRLNQTSIADFTAAYGEGTLTEEFAREGFTGGMRTYEYPWGTVTLTLKQTVWTVVELDIKQGGTLGGPRSTNIGDSETFVVNKFRDMGQITSASGNRGLYASDTTSGKIWKQDDGGSIVRYRYYSDGHWTQLDYHTGSNGTVNEIHLQYIP
jgi:tetratricopeptide (TPR) repeat protein